MERPFFSIVMPAYGVERYLKKAVESIEKQTFSEWELIIVEDGSPDKTGELAEYLKTTDSRIQVLHHSRNRGLSPARNTGMEAAGGEYIWFMDPDDYVEKDLLERVYESLQKNPADIVVFGHIEEYFDSLGKMNYSHEVKPEEHYFSNPEEVHKHIIFLEQETLYGYAWNKFYKLNHIRKAGLLYENVKLIEDIVFNIQYCRDIKSMNVLAITPYHYAKRADGSLTTKFVKDYYPLHRRRIEMLYEQIKYWKCATEENRSIIGSLYGRYILSALERNCDKRSGMRHGDRVQFCRELFADGLYKTLIPAAKARDSKALKVTLFCLNKNSVFLCLLLGRGIHIIRNRFPMFYSKIKSER